MKMTSSFASSEGDEDEMDMYSDKEGEEGTTKIGRDGKELMFMAFEYVGCKNNTFLQIKFNNNFAYVWQFDYAGPVYTVAVQQMRV